MKTVKLSLETAKQMYKSSDEGIKAFALENYTKEELEAKELPTKWENLVKVNGFFIISDGTINESSVYTHSSYSNGVWPTKELAEASVALAKLIYLRDIYNGDWKADYTKDGQSKHLLYYDGQSLVAEGNYYFVQRILSFKDFKTADLFRTNFRNLIEIAKPLL